MTDGLALGAGERDDGIEWVGAADRTADTKDMADCMEVARPLLCTATTLNGAQKHPAYP